LASRTNASWARCQLAVVRTVLDSFAPALPPCSRASLPSDIALVIISLLDVDVLECLFITANSAPLSASLASFRRPERLFSQRAGQDATLRARHADTQAFLDEPSRAEAVRRGSCQLQIAIRQS
jgi:hypothetical protein